MTDVCQLLKETRASRGLSLEEVAQKTYIKVYYLEALEEGLLDRLPAPVHTFGYIRLYAKLLGLDGGALVAQFQQQKGLASNTNGSSPNRNGRGSGALTEWAAGFMANRPVGNGQPTPNGNGHGVANGALDTGDHGLGNVSPVGQADTPEKTFPPAANPIVARKIFAEPLQAHESNKDRSTDDRSSLAAQQILATAERDAQQLVRGAESYADDVLATLETEVDKALQIVRNGREFLKMRRQPASPGNESALGPA
jgi:hypothetical protein